MANSTVCQSKVSLKIHTEAVLCEFRNVHNSKPFVDGLLSVRMYEDQTQ